MTNQGAVKTFDKEFQLIIPVIVGIITLIGTIIGILMKYYFDKKIELQKQRYILESKNLEHKYRLESEYDLELRTKRIESYKKLWQLMLILNFHDASDNNSYYQLANLKTKMTEWYYLEGGGIFLTEINQKLYINFLREIKETMETVCNLKTKTPEIRKEKLDNLKNLSSAFRSSLLKSIGTREEPKYPNTYGDLKIEFNGGRKVGEDERGNKRYIYYQSEGHKKVIIKINQLVGIDRIYAINYYKVSVQIIKIDGNVKVYGGETELENPFKNNLVWEYKWDLPNWFEGNNKISGGYIVVANMEKIDDTKKIENIEDMEIKLQRQYSAVDIFYIKQ
jgi:hypothetical protein